MLTEDIKHNMAT